MTKNIGRLDRTIRVLAGLGLLTLVFIGPKTLWGLLGILVAASGFIGY